MYKCNTLTPPPMNITKSILGGGGGGAGDKFFCRRNDVGEPWTVLMDPMRRTLQLAWSS